MLTASMNKLLPQKIRIIKLIFLIMGTVRFINSREFWKQDRLKLWPKGENYVKVIEKSEIPANKLFYSGFFWISQEKEPDMPYLCITINRSYEILFKQVAGTTVYTVEVVSANEIKFTHHKTTNPNVHIFFEFEIDAINRTINLTVYLNGANPKTVEFGTNIDEFDNIRIKFKRDWGNIDASR